MPRPQGRAGNAALHQAAQHEGAVAGRGSRRVGARAVGVGDQSAALLFGQSQGDSAKGPLITVDALQPAPGGDAEAYLVVLPTP